MENRQKSVFVAIFVAIVCLFWFWHQSTAIPRSDLENAVQSTISKNLFNPSGAKFSPDSQTTITKNSDGSYEVDGWVDDNNALGATIRNNYKATVTSDGDNWNVSAQLQNAITGQWY